MKIDLSTSTKALGLEIIKNEETYFARFKKHQRFNFNDKNEVFYLSKGNISICTKKDDVTISFLEASTIIGLSFINAPPPLHYLRCESDCECYIIDVNHMMNMIDSKDLWKDAFISFVETAQKFINIDAQEIQKNNYNIVFECLIEIWSLEQDVRKRTSIYNYIFERYSMSRSTIQRIIKNLQKEKIIDTVQGKLIGFNIICGQ